MKRLTEKEEEVMLRFWEHGEMYVRDILATYPDPKPHFNTVSTFVRFLEQKGFVSHKRTGASYLYYPIVTEEEYHTSSLRSIMNRYFSSSVKNVVSALVKTENLSDEEVDELINLVKSKKQQ